MPLLVAATVFSSLVTFMSSVYVKHKRSVNSFVTAMIGAVSNLILNFILIPSYGAQGAAIATLACYVIVYVIRVFDTRRYERFNTKNVTMLINSLLMGIQCAAMLFEVKYWYICGAVCLVVIGIVNFKALFSSAKTVFLSVLGKIKH